MNRSKPASKLEHGIDQTLLNLETKLTNELWMWAIATFLKLIIEFENHLLLVKK